MFSLKENDEIGAYFSKLVEEKHYESMRQFAREYLKLANEDTDKPSVDKLCNRLSQIKKGTKGIQLKDLPIFTHLLDVTCEELLSAGESRVPNAGRMTLAHLAYSQSESDWSNFLEQDDHLLLNHDEFGKTIINYALEFKNYNLLVYLIQNHYLCFISPDPADYGISFGGGITLPYGHSHSLDGVAEQLKGNDCFRRQMISLSIEHNDLQMLEALHARELPPMYLVSSPHCLYPNSSLSFYDEDMIDQIARANDRIIDYFSQEYTIPCCRDTSYSNTYTYPYLNRVLDRLIKGQHPRTEHALEDAIAHNRKTLETMKKMIENGIQCTQQEFGFSYGVRDQIMRGLHFFLSQPDRNIVIFSVCESPNFITNLISVHTKSSDPRISALIKELNESYDKIMEIKTENDKE